MDTWPAQLALHGTIVLGLSCLAGLPQTAGVSRPDPTDRAPLGGVTGIQRRLSWTDLREVLPTPGDRET
jgi:hypothetical protein